MARRTGSGAAVRPPGAEESARDRCDPSWDPHPSSTRRRLAALPRELGRERAFLLPLRLFIGLGWLRAGGEKLIDAGWYDGSALRAFLTEQLAWSQEAFPWFGALMERVLFPLATPVGLVVVLLQLAVGVAILIGFRTGPALLAGILLNVTFVLSGVPDPSVFYIVIQLVLFAGGAGFVLGVDGGSSRVPTPAVVARRRRRYAVVAVGCVAFASVVAPSVANLAPATVVEDPAMMLLVLALFAASVAGLGAVRDEPTPAMADGASAAGGEPEPPVPVGAVTFAAVSTAAGPRPQVTPAGAPLR